MFEGSSDSAIAIIRITGNLNLANAPLLEDQLADLLHKEYGETENEQPPTILLDLSCVPHIDPSGKHIEAFSTLVESLVKITCIDFTNFLKLAEFTI